MTTKITWPLDASDEITLTENADGTKSASYLDGQLQVRTVVINPDGSRDQTVGEFLKVRYEIGDDGVLLQRTEFSDGLLWKAALHPGFVTHVLTTLNTDGTSSELTHYSDRGVRKSVDTAADGRVTTVITNKDGLQRIVTQP